MVSKAGSAESGAVNVRKSGPVTTLFLGDPTTQNRLSPSSVSSLRSALQALDEDDSSEIVVLRSRGAEFCVGMDLDSVNGTPGAQETPIAEYGEVLRILTEGRFCSIILVEGPAIAGGIGLVSAGQIVLATSAASFSLPELLFGLIPANVYPALMRRLTPAQILYFTQSRVTWSAEEALRTGLVDELVEPSRIEKRTRRLLRDLLRNSPHAAAMTRSFLRTLYDTPLPAKRREAAAGLLLERVKDPEVREAIGRIHDGELPDWAQPLPSGFSLDFD